MLFLFKLITQYSKQSYSIIADLTCDFTHINVKFWYIWLCLQYKVLRFYTNTIFKFCSSIISLNLHLTY